MKDGQCSRNYPNLNINGFPEYKRTEHSPPRTLKKGILGVGSVVPHNIKLLEMFECHINVEVCTSIRAIKYLYKYSYKGPDRACVEKSVNEVTEFLDTRYCGAPEAAWRLFQFPLHGKSHAVDRLPVHLPLEQSILFRSGEEREAVERCMQKRTKLQAWFDLNASASTQAEETCALIRRLRYHELPKHLRWDASTCTWRRRAQGPKGGDVLGRLRHVSARLLQSTRIHKHSVYIYIYIYRYIYTYTYTYLYCFLCFVFLFVFVNLCTHIYIYIYMCIYI